MAQNKKTFLMYKDWIPMMKSMPKDKLGELMYAVACYQDGDEVEISDPMVEAMFSMFKLKFDENDEAYRERCETNARIAKERESTNRHETSRIETDMDKDMDRDKDIDKDKDFDNESLKGHKTSCSEQSSEPEVTPDCEPLVLADGSEWWPTVERYADYVRCFPGVDVKQEFAKMRSWCLDNPKKRKTKIGVSRFVSSWLSKAQDRGRASPYMDTIRDRVAVVDSW